MQRAPLYLLMVFASAFLLLVLTGGSEGRTITVDGSGGADYSTIQDAVDASEEGDTIRVFEGTYNEVVWINISLDLVGNGSSKTIIDGTGLVGFAETGPSLVYLQADWCNISGFSMIKIRNFMCAGIEIRSDYNRIFNNNCSHNDYGILIKNSTDNVIEDNSLYSNEEDGIGLDSNSANNTIHFNDIWNNGEHGIEVMDDSGLVTNATNNWWGDDSGPYHPTKNPNGKGDNVSDYVEFDPWTGKDESTMFYGNVREKNTDFPIANAVVHISDGDSIEYSTYTDANGYYEQEVDPGDYTIIAEKDGYTWFWELEVVKIEDGESMQYNLMLMKEQVAFNVELTCSEYRINLADKNITILSLTLRNTGMFNDTYNLTISGNFPGWKASLEVFSNIALQSGATRTISLALVEDSNDGQNDEDKREKITVTITVMSVTHEEVQDSITLEGHLVSDDDGLEIPFLPPAAIGFGIAAGGMVAFFRRRQIL